MAACGTDILNKKGQKPIECICCYDQESKDSDPTLNSKNASTNDYKIINKTEKDEIDNILSKIKSNHVSSEEQVFDRNNNKER